MENYWQQLKSLYEKIGLAKVSYEKSGVRPFRDWKIMLTGTFLVLVCMAIFALNFYFKVDRGEVFVVSRGTLEKEAEINTRLLKKIVTEIKEREDFLKQLKSENQVPGDPSI